MKAVTHQIKHLPSQLPMLMVRQMERKMNNPKRRNFEFQNKPGRWLAYILQKEKEQKVILKLQERTTLITDDVNI